MASATHPPDVDTAHPQADMVASPGDIGLVSVITPAYNEATNLKKLLPEIHEVLSEETYPFEVIVVDDASTDETSDVIHHHAKLFDEITGVSLARNVGQSTALSAGIDHAAGDVIVTIDADNQNDPSDIPRLIHTLTGDADGLKSGFDCVSGRRRERDDPLSKRVPSKVQTWLAKYTGPDIHDFGCTLKAYRADALHDISLYGEGHRYIPAKLYAAGYTITEIDVTHHPRRHGSSHYGVGRLLRGFVDLLYHVFRTRYRTRPMHVFGAVALFSVVFGMGIGGWLVGTRYLFGVPVSSNLPKLILSVALVLFGFGAFSLGVITEFLTELLHRTDSPYRVRTRYTGRRDS